MRKSIFTLAVLLGASTSIFAQDLTSRKGENYLPEAGDWAIGIDGVPLLNYLGNFFGKSANNGFAGNIWSYSNPNMLITGKYFVEDQVAFRAGIRLGFGGDKSKVNVENRAVSPSDWPTKPNEVENTHKLSATNVGLNFGIEWRKGNTRLQGFYGAELGFMVGTKKDRYTYGNALTSSTAAIPVVVTGADNFGSNIIQTADGNGTPIDGRVLENKAGATFGLGVRGFIGAEYFIIPKLSLGGEFGWGIAFMNKGRGTQTYETVGYTTGATNSQIVSITTETGKESSFGVDVSTVNPLFGPVGRLNLTFHF